MQKIGAVGCALWMQLFPLELQAQAVEMPDSLLNNLLTSIQEEVSFNSYINVTSSQSTDINASISALLLGGVSESYGPSQLSQITARLGPIYTTGIGAIMPEGVLNLQDDPLPATIDQSYLTGTFREIHFAATGSAYAVHADNYGEVSNIPNLVLNASSNASVIAADIELQLQSVALSLQDAETFGIGSALSGQILHTTAELQFSLVGLRN